MSNQHPWRVCVRDAGYTSTTATITTTTFVRLHPDCLCHPQEQALTKSNDAADRALHKRELHVEQAERLLKETKAQQAARAARLDELAAALETRSRALKVKGSALAEAHQQQAAVRCVCYVALAVIIRFFNSPNALNMVHLSPHTYCSVTDASIESFLLSDPQADKALSRREAHLESRAAELDQAQHTLESRLQAMQDEHAALEAKGHKLDEQQRALDNAAAQLDTQRQALHAAQQDAQTAQGTAGMALEAKGQALEEAAAALEAQQQQVLSATACMRCWFVVRWAIAKAHCEMVPHGKHEQAPHTQIVFFNN